MLPAFDVVPVHLGPTWEKNPDWDGVNPGDEFVLPEITLGWQILAWIEKNLQSDEVDMATGAMKPFKPTREQTRFVLWWYAVDETGRFVYRDGILQRLKGWGKDPLVAVLSAVEFVGPCRFAGWATTDLPDLDLEQGDPVAREHPRAWVQIVAVSESQTENTMNLFPGLFTPQCVKEHSIDVGKTVIYAHGAQRRIKAVTSNPRSLEGGRATFTVRNETHHWIESNNGHELAATIERNATKSKDGAARALSITNAYEPSEGSVAQKQREAWEDEEAGLTFSTGVLYDSLEMPAGTPLAPKGPPGPDGKPTKPPETWVRAYLGTIVRAIRGDSIWLDEQRIVNSILDANNPVSRSKRFWLNLSEASEDAWAVPAAIEAAIDPLAREARAGMVADPLRAGWLVLPGEDIVVFFDGSKSNDATALVGCRISDGYVFTLGVWSAPPADRGGKVWTAPRGEVNARVDEIFERFNVVAFFADPSHAKDDDEEADRYWDGMIDGWHRKYKDQLALWSVKGGDHEHSIMWDMTSPSRTAQFVAAAETYIEELHNQNEIEDYVPLFTHDGHPALIQHMRNAKEAPGKYGTSLRKDTRGNLRKIDLAVAAVGARMLRRLVLNKGAESEKPVNRRAWGNW